MRAMSDDQFTKLYKYMQTSLADMRQDMDARFAKVDQNFDRIFGLFDAHIKRMEIIEQEHLALDCQCLQHQRWIKQLAEGTGTKLKPTME